MAYAETSISAHDGTQLFARVYSPHESQACDRTMVVVHGTSEHGGRYDHVAKTLVDNGWKAIVLDLRGHGHSAGTPVHVDCFERYLLDLETVWRYFELNPKRTALLGHSFGGLISLRFAQTRGQMLSALTLISPLLRLGVEVDRFTLCLGKLMSWIAPRTRFKSRVPSEHTTRNPEVLARRENDSLIHRSITAAWFFQMQSALRAAWRESPRLQTPLLLMQAGSDRIVDPSAAEPWFNSTASGDRTFEFLPEHYHELLNEPDWRETLNLVMRWLDVRLPCTGKLELPTR